MFLLQTSCINMSSMQTGKTVGQDNTHIGVGGGYIDHTLDLEDVDLDDPSFSVPYLEASATHGLTDQLDIGASFTLIGTIDLNAKYQFLGGPNNDFAGSIGVGAGGLPFGDFTMYDFTIPAYFSHHPSERIAIYATPRFILRGIEDQTTTWGGSTIGARIGEGTAFILEGGYYVGQDDLNITQATVGLAVPID